MSLTNAVEWVAFILATIFIVNTIILAFNRGYWLSIARRMMARPKIMIFIALILAILIFVFLMANLSIVQIYASFALFILLMYLSLAEYRKELTGMAAIASKRRRDVLNWVVLLIWLGLSIWVVLELFLF